MNKDMVMVGGGSIVGIIALAAFSVAKRAVRAAEEANKRADQAEAWAKTSDDIIGKLSEKLNMSLMDIEKRTTIDISDSLIDDVVATMAERKLDRVIPGKVQDAVDSIKAEAIKKIKTDISEAVAKSEPEIKNTLEGQVRNVSIDDMKRAVIDKAAKEAKDESLHQIRRETDHQLEEIQNYARHMRDEIDDKIDDVLDDLQLLIIDCCRLHVISQVRQLADQCDVERLVLELLQ